MSHQDDAERAGGSGPQAQHDADRACTEHGDGVADADRRLTDGVKRYGGRFAHRGLLVGERVVEEDQVPLLHGDVFGESAVAPRAVVVVIAALCVFSHLAGFAFAARQQREDCGTTADERRVVGFDDLPGEFVAGNRREMVGSFGKDARQIASADSAGVHFEQHLSRLTHGHGHILVTQVADRMEVERFHRIFHLFIYLGITSFVPAGRNPLRHPPSRLLVVVSGLQRSCVSARRLSEFPDCVCRTLPIEFDFVLILFSFECFYKNRI